MFCYYCNRNHPVIAEKTPQHGFDTWDFICENALFANENDMSISYHSNIHMSIESIVHDLKYVNTYSFRDRSKDDAIIRSMKKAHNTANIKFEKHKRKELKKKYKIEHMPSIRDCNRCGYEYNGMIPFAHNGDLSLHCAECCSDYLPFTIMNANSYAWVRYVMLYNVIASNPDRLGSGERMVFIRSRVLQLMFIHL
jgi:hypothetical protein